MHTPGPWEYFEAKTTDGERTLGIRGNTEFIATMDLHSINGGPFVLPPNGVANARLMTAAPDLLEACQRLVTVVGQLEIGHPLISDAHSAAKNARAAITKASGE